MGIIVGAGEGAGDGAFVGLDVGPGVGTCRKIATREVCQTNQRYFVRDLTRKKYPKTTTDNPNRYAISPLSDYWSELKLDLASALVSGQAWGSQ